MLKYKARGIRKAIVEMIHSAGSGHPGGALSCADVMAALYFCYMRHRPDDPTWTDRDRFVLCKGHAAPVLYATLALAGYFPYEELLTLRKFGSRLQGHPDMKRTPGLDASTGSIGQGLSIACGLALGAKLQGKQWRVFALLGDGDLDEGQTWEAAMFASHYRLYNLVAIIDRNGLQVDGPTEKVMSLEPVCRKWAAFGWRVMEIDGNKMEEVVEALEWAVGGSCGRRTSRPSCIVARTIKGKGVSIMEGNPDFHGRAPSQEEYEIAMRELGTG
ncbi:MAG: transketolase [Bacillota bacterium]